MQRKFQRYEEAIVISIEKNLYFNNIDDILKIVKLVSAKCNPNFVSTYKGAEGWKCKDFSSYCTSSGDYKSLWKVWKGETFWGLKNELGETPLVCPQCGCAGNKATP